jgi:glycosyltransferase involved in cell wall biosynthesis
VIGGVHEAPARADLSVVTETYPPEINGVASTVGHLVRGLAGRGRAVSLIRPRQGLADVGSATALVRGWPLPRYAGVQIGAPAPGLLRDVWTRRRPAAVYVATEGPLGYSAVLTARRMGIRVVSGFHTNFHGYLRHYRAAWLRHVALGYLRHVHNLADATVVATEALRERLHALGFANLAVLGRGVDTELFSPARRSAGLRAAWGVAENELVVLHVGRIAPEKNLALAIEAYRAMARDGRAARFVVVGDGPLRGAVQRANPDLIFTGVLTGERLAAHYASADVFVLSSETETFGNVTLEALASGLAVVAFDDAAASVHVADGVSGALAPRGDARAFVAAARDLVQAPERLAGMRRRARAAVADLDWCRIVERFESLLEGPLDHDDALVPRRKETR